MFSRYKLIDFNAGILDVLIGKYPKRLKLSAKLQELCLLFTTLVPALCTMPSAYSVLCKNVLHNEQSDVWYCLVSLKIGARFVFQMKIRVCSFEMSFSELIR